MVGVVAGVLCGVLRLVMVSLLVWLLLLGVGFSCGLCFGLYTLYFVVVNGHRFP